MHDCNQSFKLEQPCICRSVVFATWSRSLVQHCSDHDCFFICSLYTARRKDSTTVTRISQTPYLRNISSQGHTVTKSLFLRNCLVHECFCKSIKFFHSACCWVHGDQHEEERKTRNSKRLRNIFFTYIL